MEVLQDAHDVSESGSLESIVRATLVVFVLGAVTSVSAGGVQTVGVFVNEPDAFVGYTLFSQIGGRTTYLIDNEGRVVNTWESVFTPGLTFYLKDNGNLVRTGDAGTNPVFAGGGDAGIVQEFNWEGTLLWQYTYSDEDHRAHHDIAVLPNGNVLILAWELRTNADAIAAGRNPALLNSVLWPEHIVEVEPNSAAGGTIVWEWHLWDHLIQDFDPAKANYGVVGDHPELVDINFIAHPNPDWLHANALDYDPALDQIMISLRHFNELWIIDHSTTTAEAATHTGGLRGRGGDLLYRWGNPQTYRAGTSADQKLFGQHDAHWIAEGLPGAGHILVFNNGDGRPAGAFSTVEELVAPIDAGGDYVHVPGTAFGPADPVWIYTGAPPGDLYSPFLSGCRRLPNGNTLIIEGASGDLREVRAADDAIVWRYVSPVRANDVAIQGLPPGVNMVFRAARYAPDFPGFAGRDLTPGRLIEIYPGDVDGDGIVAFADILGVIAAWGPCPGGGDPCWADLDRNGVVGFGDILQVIANWS